MTTLMRFAAFLFRHPVVMVFYWIVMCSLQYYLLMWIIQSVEPAWWTPTVEMWVGLIWLGLCVVSFGYVFYVRSRFGWLFNQLFGDMAKQ